ncbi:ABC transporter permease [Pseudoflavonifractor sp. An176]|uniref:ABC transporter permease n=1 Tax=Pseudoflavonifractor sp. An176 TaxID=1965572 RepID=UPI000B37F7A2|nr:ABC transporter permease [Pseudoflavonifractor sp. An176]OUP65431.1 ABC transporter permease [Pseudoflavonifractor sp. An176]
MWKDYSIGFIKKNRASSVSVLVAAFISALFLSLLCGLFYNFWNYEIESVVLEEGNWQGRISGSFEEDTVSEIENFATVKTAVLNEELSDDQTLVVDICFDNMRAVYQDMPLIARQLGVPETSVSYHESLLSNYFINDPQDSNPPLLMAFYLFVLLLVSVSLILIIHNSFAVSMNTRVHQFGIFSSIGATPGQIRICLLQEAVMLCVIPILLGSFFGIALTFGTIQAVNVLAEGIVGRHEAVFTYHPLVFAVTILTSFLTVLISTWLPARKLSKMTPLEAIKNTEELQLKRRKKSRILALLFGTEGELAGNALKAQKKSLRTATLSLTLSFLGFALMLSFFTLSGISTNHTYFERYQDAWDVMGTLEDTKIEDFAYTNEIHALADTDSVIYQKADATCFVPADAISEEVKSLGGLEAIAGSDVSAADGIYTIQAPIVIMDDSSFVKYCEQIGVSSAENGSVVLNRIWDNINSNFRYKEYVPFLSENQDTMTLQNKEDMATTVSIPVLGLTQEPPILREEYDNYALVQFVSLSTWKQIQETIGNAGPGTYIRILSENERTLTKLNAIETELTNVLGHDLSFEVENRVQEKIDNDAMLNGYKLVVGALCVLLAIIGIANVFSNTLGFIRQRKREFARYMSIGMTPESMRKMFWIEALVIAGRPVLITLPVTSLFVWFMITASYLNPMEFLAVAPIVPILLFIVALFGFVALAYYLGGKQILKCNLVEALRSDYMV